MEIAALQLRPGEGTPDLHFDYFAAGSGWERASEWASPELERAGDARPVQRHRRPVRPRLPRGAAVRRRRRDLALAKESAYFMAANGIISGMDDAAFSPRGVTAEGAAPEFSATTREQALVLGLRLVESRRELT